MSPKPSQTITKHFATLPDPRVGHAKQHLLGDILVIAICAIICGADTWVEVAAFGKAKRRWFKRFLALPHGIPSHDTFNRVFAALDPKEFLECFLRWTQSLRQAVAQEIVALDGKALRRALNRDESPKYVVSAWAESNNLVLGQLKVTDKSNEITALPELLRVLELSGCIVTVDAMGTQKKIAQEIVEADAGPDGDPAAREHAREPGVRLEERAAQGADVGGRRREGLPGEARRVARRGEVEDLDRHGGIVAAGRPPRPARYRRSSRGRSPNTVTARMSP